jgi:hypothetical protein
VTCEVLEVKKAGIEMKIVDTDFTTSGKMTREVAHVCSWPRSCENLGPKRRSQNVCSISGTPAARNHKSLCLT